MLPTDILDKWAKEITKSDTKEKKVSEFYGTAKVADGGGVYVALDGSLIKTPAIAAVSCSDGDRVLVRIKDHSMLVTSNISDPLATATMNDLAVGKADGVAKDLTTFKTEYESFAQTINNSLRDLQNQIDGAIMTWFYAGTPSLNGYPVTDWETAAEKDAHLGDLYYDTETGYSYRFAKENGVYSWMKISDVDVAAALEIASKAQDTADNKRRVFSVQPYPPYDKGDLWVQGDSGEILFCNTPKADGQAFAASDWVIASKYGKAIYSSEEQFYQSTSPTALQGGSWSKNNTWVDGKYTWRRTLITYGDGVTEYEPSPNGVCISGNTGAQGLRGLQGERGEQGIPGQDGRTSYFHIKYSAFENPTASQMVEEPSTYIGTYVDFTAADSTDPKKYTWSRFEGIQGATGAQGIPGVNGSNGKTSYLHIAYANSADGTSGFSVSDSAGKLYIGQYTDFIQADSTSPSKYSWTKIKGETGATGAQGSGVNMVYKSDVAYNTSSYHMATYNLSDDLVTGNVYTVTIWGSLASGKQFGLWGQAGSTNLSFLTLLRTGVYRGVFTAPATIGNPNNHKIVTVYNCPSNVSGTSVINKIKIEAGNVPNPVWTKAPEVGATGKGVKTSAVTYQASTSGTSVPTGTWSSSVPSVAAGSFLWTRTVITYTDNATTTSYSVGKMGSTGATGSAGRGIKSTAITYQAWANGTSTPTGTWAATPPKTSAAKPYLWTRTIITYTDNTTSTSYSVGSTPEGIVVGGRNLLYDTKGMTVERVSGTSQRVYTTYANAVGTGGGLARTADGIKLTFGAAINVSIQAPLASFGNVANGEVVTLSFEYRGNIASFGYFYFLQQSGANIVLKGFPGVIGDGMWHKYTHTFSSTDANVRTCTSILMFYYLQGYDNTKWVEIKEGTLKLEKGNTATDWTPAPEDTHGEIYNRSGTCPTPAGTAKKIATLPGFSLYKGATVSITFSQANTAVSPTLNVNGTGDKPIRTNGTATAYWAAGAAVLFCYDGTNWQVCSSPVYASTVTVGNPAGGNVYIDSDSVDIRTGGTVNATFGNTATIGKATGGNVYIDNDSVDIRKGTKQIASLGIGKRTLQWEGNIDLDSTFLKTDNAIDITHNGFVDLFNYDANSLTASPSSKEVKSIFLNTGIGHKHDNIPYVSNGTIDVTTGYHGSNTSSHIALRCDTLVNNADVNDGSAYIDLSSSSVGGDIYMEAQDGAANFSMFSLSPDSVLLSSDGSVEVQTFDVVTVLHNNTANSVGFGVGSGGVNRGVHDSTKGKWMIYNNDSGKTIIPQPLIVQGHSTAIGSCIGGANGTDVALTKSTWKSVYSLSLPAGTWIVVGTCSMNVKNTGKFGLSISGASNNYNDASVIYQPNQASSARMNCSRIMNLSATSTIYLVALSSVDGTTVTHKTLWAARIA